MGKISSDFLATATLIIIIGLGLFSFLKAETDKVSRTSNIIIPMIAGQSFYIGCMVGVRDSESCMNLMEIYKRDTAEINRIED